MAFGSGLGGLTKKFNFSQIFKIGLSFIVLDMQANMLAGMQGIGPGVKALAGISLQLAKFGLIAKLGKGLPFGLGSILTAITGVQATTYAIGQLPAIMSLISGGGFSQTQFFGGPQAPTGGYAAGATAGQGFFQ